MDDIIELHPSNQKVMTDSAQLTSQRATAQPLRNSVERAMRSYFEQLGEMQPTNLYELVLAEVEVPLLQVVLQKTRGNQTRAAKQLGLSRGTLRKKLKQYNLD